MSVTQKSPWPRSALEEAVEQPAFGRFPNLPTEVRLMIWQQACLTERIIPLLPGQGHLFPRVHPTHAVPPILHACPESRQVALDHYHLAFHPRIYTNRQYDVLMLHIFYPREVIDPNLYTSGTAGFNWDAAPRRFAVLLDDISFHQSDTDLYRGAWKTDPTWRQRLVPFSQDFVATVVPSSIRNDIDELILLVLPPLTARPNPTAHRFDLVEGVSDLVDMSEYLTGQLRDRISLLGFGEDSRPVIQARVRHATCTSWAPDPDVSWSVDLRQRHSAADYADLEFGTKTIPDPTLSVATFFSPGPGVASRDDRIKAIQKDLALLGRPFSASVGLGPSVMWEEPRGVCGTVYLFMLRSGIRWDAQKTLLWVFDHEDAVPKIRPPPSFDFDKFLEESTEEIPLGVGNNSSDKDNSVDGEKHHDEEEEADSWNMQCLRFNGLLLFE